MPGCFAEACQRDLGRKNIHDKSRTPPEFIPAH